MSNDIIATLVQIAERLRLTAPLTFFDTETTGVNPDRDRIVEISAVRVSPAGSVVGFGTHRIHPGIPIPAEASAVHGITDADVRDAATFGQLASTLRAWFEGTDLAGYNAARFDRRILAAEFMRAGMEETAQCVLDARVVDVQTIFFKHEPRDLSAALRFFCGESHDGAHGSAADVVAAVKVFAAQLDRYDLPKTVDGLVAFCDPRDPSWLDREGKIAWRGGEACINFGKNQGVPLRMLVTRDRSFLDWLLRSDFAEDTKALVRAALKGQYPTPPAAAGAA